MLQTTTMKFVALALALLLAVGEENGPLNPPLLTLFEYFFVF